MRLHDLRRGKASAAVGAGEAAREGDMQDVRARLHDGLPQLGELAHAHLRGGGGGAGLDGGVEVLRGDRLVEVIEVVDAIFVPVEAGVGNLTGIEEALVPVRGGAAGKREVCYGGTSLSARHASGTASTKGAPPRRTFYMLCTAGPNPASMERSSRPDAASPCKKSTVPMRQKHDVHATK